jgi:hypothetical protein
MKHLNLSRQALGIGAFVFLLTGCGGQSGAPSATQNAASVAHIIHGGSWMKPGASGSDLLYVGSFRTSDVYVFTYPGGSEPRKLGHG